jgi:hypothetical protein
VSDPANDDEEEELELGQGLIAVGRFARLVKSVPWFSTVGDELDGKDIDNARTYLEALGFPEADIADVANWLDAEVAARNPDWNPEWWEAEEQLRMALLDEATALHGEESLLIALTHVTSTASDLVQAAATTAAARTGNADEGLIRAAAGAATQACYQAALVLAAEGEPEHAFAAKFRLFESGRWPLGIVGNTFHLF